MEVEYTTRLIQIIDAEAHKAEVERLAKEGWQLVPGVQPVAIYNLVRQKNIPAAAQPIAAAAAVGAPVLTIDDSKIFMMKPDGKLT